MPEPRYATIQEAHLIAQYREWSESFFAAGFCIVNEDFVRSFRESNFSDNVRQVLTEYEIEFLDEWERQENLESIDYE